MNESNEEHGLDGDEEPIIGECFFCKQQKEIVATMNVSARTSSGAEVGATGHKDACEGCVRAAVDDMRRLAEARKAAVEPIDKLVLP